MTTTNTQANKITVSSTSLSPGMTLFGPKPGMNKAPRVFYEPGVLEVIQYIVDKCPKEVGWWGLVRREPDTMDFYIYKIFVPEQTVTGAETDISADAMNALAMEILNAGGNTEDLYYWGHSHVNMGVGPSGQDERQVEEYLPNVDFFIRGIYNKSGSAKVDVYDTQRGIAFQCVTNEKKDHGLDANTVTALDTLIKTNVKEQVYQTSTSYYGNGYGSGRGYQSQQSVLNEKFDATQDMFVIGKGAKEYVKNLLAQHNKDMGNQNPKA